DEDAVVEAAHPAREKDLRAERKQRREDADEEHLAGDELRQPVLAAVGEDGAYLRDDARSRRCRRGGRVGRAGWLRFRRKPGCGRGQGHGKGPSKDSLRLAFPSPRGGRAAALEGSL